MSENWSDELKNIGDAGDSSRDEVDENSGNPVCEMVGAIKRALQCGDHQGLMVHLGTLEEWRRCGRNNLTHDYWRVAQYIGETELNNVYLLLTVTWEKPDNIKWSCLGDVLSLLALSLCNREIIFRLLIYASNVIPILVEAVGQDQNEDARLHALTIINVSVTVARARFARGLLNANFLDKLVDRLNDQGPHTSGQLLEKILEVIKSLLMCGQPYTHGYATEILSKMTWVMEYHLGHKPLHDFFHDLVRSADIGDKPHICAKYWTKGRLRKELLSRCLRQPWLYIYCSWPACGNHNAALNTFFRKCAACSTVRYCSRQCQEKHWWGGHNIQCKMIARPV
ncbi:unnamed protein product [Lymnaea stagnalis]|uniref:MYND-type domain-containing protein n=1 Tax=Lymnaea stagnalis TaxID=6523 RepID=A0AAV2HN85_LYMST